MDCDSAVKGFQHSRDNAPLSCWLFFPFTARCVRKSSDCLFSVKDDFVGMIRSTKTCKSQPQPSIALQPGVPNLCCYAETLDHDKHTHERVRLEKPTYIALEHSAVSGQRSYMSCTAVREVVMCAECRTLSQGESAAMKEHEAARLCTRGMPTTAQKALHARSSTNATRTPHADTLAGAIGEGAGTLGEETWCSQRLSVAHPWLKEPWPSVQVRLYGNQNISLSEEHPRRRLPYA